MVRQIYELDQPVRTFAKLSNRRDGVDFQATCGTIGVRVIDGSGRGVAGVNVLGPERKAVRRQQAFRKCSFLVTA